MTTTQERPDLSAMPLNEAMAYAEERGLHFLSIADSTGDTRIMWNPRDKDEVATAKAAFDAALGKGMLAYSVDPGTGDSSGEVVRKFDAKLGKVIMTKPLQGG